MMILLISVAPRSARSNMSNRLCGRVHPASRLTVLEAAADGGAPVVPPLRPVGRDTARHARARISRRETTVAAGVSVPRATPAPVAASRPDASDAQTAWWARLLALRLR